MLYLIINNDIQAARSQLGRIVGRDTSELDKKAIIRATIETIAENIVDGFTSPIFYLSIGGIPLAYLYKTVNTLDSMVGYKNKRYKRFGTISAKLDDFLNFIPARLNLIFIFFSTGFNKNIFKYVKKYAKLHPSPNSGISESCFSAYLGLALGGPSKYEGIWHEKAWLGKNLINNNDLENPELILKAIDLYWRVIYITLIIFLTIVFIFKLPIIFR